MPRKRLPKGQRSLLDPEVEAVTDFKDDMGKLVFNMEVVCPFCAWMGRVIQFRTKKSEASKSYSTKMFKCPDCGQGMRRDTLLRDLTVSEWARWLYTNVIMYGGYNRISFPKLLQRLKEYGWASEFWSAWKAVKENRTTSDVEDYLDYVKASEAMSAQDARDMCDKFKQGLAGRNSMVCSTCDIRDMCWPKEVGA